MTTSALSPSVANPVQRGASTASEASVIGRLAASGIAWGFAVSAFAILLVVFGLGGAEYYTTPLEIRGYAAGHRLLRPSGPVGQTLGLMGTVLMMVPFIYMARKRIKSLKPVGTVKIWLEIHLFCGIVGPVLVTLHTSFKFNGIISAAYWSMVLVMLSGFVGPLSVRADSAIDSRQRVDAREVEAEADALKDSWLDAGVERRGAATDPGVRVGRRAGLDRRICRSSICCSASSLLGRQAARPRPRAAPPAVCRRRRARSDPADARRTRRCCGARPICSGRRSCSTCGTCFICRSCTCCSSSRQRTSAWRCIWATCRFAGSRGAWRARTSTDGVATTGVDDEPRRAGASPGGIGGMALLVWLRVCGRAEAQLGALLSPGPLAKPHAELEGISNCQKCHEQGRKVTAEKCLTCHAPVADRIARRVGVHKDVKTDCVTCHVGACRRRRRAAAVRSAEVRPCRGHRLPARRQARAGRRPSARPATRRARS